MLAGNDPSHFQYWSLGLVGARPVEERKGADRGIDGRLYFHVDTSGKTQQTIFSVKAGQNINVAYVRDLRGVIEREKAAIGVLITMEEPTKPMLKEAAEAGFYKFKSSFDTCTYPRIQILTIEKLMVALRWPTRACWSIPLRKPPRRERQSNNSPSIPENKSLARPILRCWPVLCAAT